MERTSRGVQPSLFPIPLVSEVERPPVSAYLLLREDPQPNLFAEGQRYVLELRGGDVPQTLDEAYGNGYARLTYRTRELSAGHGLEARVEYSDGTEKPLRPEPSFSVLLSRMLSGAEKAPRERVKN